MADKLQPGMTLPDFELPDENGAMHRLSELQGDNPMILMLGRGEHCPRERQHQKEMIKLYEWCAVGFTSLVTVLPNDQHESYKLKISTPAAWTYLCDAGPRGSAHARDRRVHRSASRRERPAHPRARPRSSHRQGLRRLLVLRPSLGLPAVGGPPGPVPPDQGRLRPDARRGARAVGGDRRRRALGRCPRDNPPKRRNRLLAAGALRSGSMDALARERPASSAEPFWPAQLAAAAALALYVTLPHALIMGPRWLVPGVEGVLLLGLMITTPTRHRKRPDRFGHRDLPIFACLLADDPRARRASPPTGTGEPRDVADASPILCTPPTRTRRPSAPPTPCHSRRRRSCSWPSNHRSR